MAKFLSKHLGKLAMMTAAALWASCSDAKEEKVDEHATPKTQASQSKDIQNAIKNINKNANSKYLPSREMDTSGVTALYGCINCEKAPIQEDSAKLDSIVELVGCLYGTCGGGGIATKAKGNVTTPTENDISVDVDSSNTKSLILKVVRQRTPGLRHIYNKYLKIRENNKKPSFKGTIVLKLEIGDLGAVSNVLVKSTTTDYPEFDEQIAKAVSRWKFPQAKHVGSITIPLTFQECK